MTRQAMNRSSQIPKETIAMVVHEGERVPESRR